MKRVFILLVASFSLLASCKKSSSSPYFMTAAVAGTAKTFNNALVATDQTNLGITTISIVGVASTTTGESIEITLDNALSGNAIVPGTYTDTSSYFDVEAAYFLNPSTAYTAGSAVAGLAAGVSITIVNHFKIVITSLTSTAVKGTFSGDFFADGDPTGVSVTILNGSFDGNFQ
jgi:hypothetical protein